MATAVLIDLSNYDTLLSQSTLSRGGGTPSGNVYFDKINGKIEFITKQEVAQVDLGSGLEDNPLDETLGIKFEAIYAFENQERADDEDLRKYDRWTSGTFKFGGAYNFENSRKPSTAADRDIIRGSGWNEYATDGGTDRIYFGNKGLANIESGSQPYYQLEVGGAPSDFAKVGQIDEAVQVFGDDGNDPVDAGAGDFDSTTYEAVSVRTYSFNYDRKETTTDLGITELGGYSTGFAVAESDHLTTELATMPLTAVYGGLQVSPWTGMSLTQLDTPMTSGGFAQADGDFTWVLYNTVPGTLYECVAFLDALAQTDDDINDHVSLVTKGKRVGTWYTYNATGQILTRTWTPTAGLYIQNVPIADQQLVAMTDDSGAVKTYPFTVSVEANIGQTANDDGNAWYHSFFATAYNTSAAITIQDSEAAEVKGAASDADGEYKIIFGFDYDGDTVGGDAATPKNCVFLCEGDGGATQAKTLYTITRITTVAFTCSPSVENNV